MSHVEMLILALLLDGLIGDPEWLWRRVWHPVVVLGHVVGGLDRALNRGGARRFKGIAAVALLCGFSLVVGWGITGIHWSLDLILAGVFLAQNSLARHVKDVAVALTTGVPEGRRAVAMIVGRDPENLDTGGIARGAIESAAENFSDGVIAPAFWYVLGGLPGIVLYKMVNTADSMIGYRNEKYQDFGWAAARLDDVMNWVPARLTGGLIALMFWSRHALRIMAKDAGKHRSLNAGWPEAAMAAVLGVALAGPRIYGGQKTDDPFVNATGRQDIGAKDIMAAVSVLWRSWGGLLVILLVAGLSLRMM